MTDVFLPTPCQCGFDRATIHDVIRIKCVGCGCNRGLLPREATILIATITAKFGAPPEVVVRKSSTAPAPEQPTNPSAQLNTPHEDPNMRTSDAFPSKYFKAGDLHGKSRRVVIDQLGSETLNGETKPVLHLRDEKSLVMNRTNFEMCEELHGDSDDWPGKAIELYPDKTTFQGRRVDCVRVRGVAKPAAKAAKPAKASASENPADDFYNDDPADL